MDANRWGLTVAEPTGDAALRQQVRHLMAAQELPLADYVPQETPAFASALDEDAFLCRAALTLLMPDGALPARLLVRHLRGHARPGNVLRRYGALRASLRAYLAVNGQVTTTPGGVLLGEQLLVIPLSDRNSVDAPLPDGIWTDLMEGEVYQTHLRDVRSINAMPVLVRANTLLPVDAVSPAGTYSDDAPCTLHWFQPAQEAQCALPGGAVGRAWRGEHGFAAAITPHRAHHFIIHEDGAERLIV